MDAVNAAEEFHWGVKAYHNSLYAESVRAFERALAFTPEDRRIVEWLGYAYYQSGYEDTALTIFEGILQDGAGTPLLSNLVDTIKARRGLTEELAEDPRYVNAFELQGQQEEFVLFSRPASLFSRADGNYYVTSFAGNEVIRFSANGAVRHRILGGFLGLDHPYDIVENRNGHVFVTEFLGNRIFRSDSDGNAILRFGEKGTGGGQLIGPQYIADDDRGYIYVTEAGNRRVSKFDYDGNFVLTFGRRNGVFPGLRSPTGICVHRERIYVADDQVDRIYVFDLSGNYLYSAGEGFLDGPEGISVYDDGVLLVADTRRVLSFDIENERFDLLTDMGGTGLQVTKAVKDVNGDIIVADFNRDSVTVLTDIANLYTGLHMRIHRVLSNNYPGVYLELTVEDRLGKPYLGLDESNFILTELRRRVQNDSFLRPIEVERSSISILLDRSSTMTNHSAALRKAAEDIFANTRENETRLQLVSAGLLPTKQGTEALGIQRFSIAAAEAGEYTEDWRFDLGLRLAASEVVSWPGPRAVVLVTQGDPGEHGFDDYPLDVLASYMRNNDIAFYCIYTRPDPFRPDEFEYLAEYTGGGSIYLYQTEGIAPLLNEISSRQSGRYFFSYQSTSDTDFGNRYLEVEAEVFHFKRSGRAESGYFAPRE